MVLKRHRGQTNAIFLTRHATESYEHNRCNFENSEQDWKVPDATDMPWHVKYEKRIPLRDVFIKVSSSNCMI